MGERESYIKEALLLLEREIGSISALSPLYNSEPWGFNAEQWFLNQAVEIETNLEPSPLLERIMEIEQQLGRNREEEKSGGYSSRVIDIDILLYEDKMVESEELTIPHPRMHLRRFVLEPLNKIAANIYHPKMGLSIGELLESCQDSSKCQIVN